MAFPFILVGLCLLLVNGVSASWWLLAMPSTQSSLIQSDDYKTTCKGMDYLVARQRELCMLSKNMLVIVSKGAQMGLKECQNQFSGRHWNCSTHFERAAPRLSAKKLLKSRNATRRLAGKQMQADAPARGGGVGDVFGGILRFHSREKAYVHAISAAGVTYSIVRACAKGDLASCSCDRNVHLKQRNKATGVLVVRGFTWARLQRDWEWGGCSEDVSYGERLSRDFVDSNDLAKEWTDPAPKLMNLHNNEAGRRAIRKSMQLACKCHGVSGSCTTKICWRKMRDFSKVGQLLYRKFDGSVRVKFSARRHKLQPAVAGHKKPRKRDLVYLEESPDYCSQNDKYGIYGTSGRACNVSSFGMDNCRVLCCGRGYKTVVVERRLDCDCKFVWCCEVRCSTCIQRTEEHYCR